MSKIKAVRFDRVSSADQRDGYSLDAQRDSGDSMAQKFGLTVVKSWSVDESASKEEDRAEFFEMIEFVKNNNVQAVIFDKIDRACRGLKSAVIIEELMTKNGVRLYFSRDNLIIDKDSPPQEKLRFSLGIMLGKYYIDNLKSEINKGIEAKRKAGVWSGKAPFGYRNISVNGRTAIDIEPAEFAVGKEVFQLYATGNYGLDDLAKYIADRVPKRKVKKRSKKDAPEASTAIVEVEFTKRLIENMIPNPFYYGAMMIKEKVYPASHQAMISKELFDACQKIRGIRAASSRSTRKGVIAKPLMGIFTCGECDHAVTGESVKKSSGKIYIYYKCANHKCAQHKKRIEQTDLFALIKEAFEPFKKWTPKATKAFIEVIHASLGDLELYTQKMTGELAEARMELKKRIEILTVLKNEGKLSPTEYDGAVAVPLKLLEDNTVEIQAYQEADLATFKRGCTIIQLFQKAYDYIQLDGNELEKIKLIQAVLSNPKLKDRTIGYEYEKPLDVLLTLTTVPVWWRRRESNPRP
jgi:site-specific DNA recombinase